MEKVVANIIKIGNSAGVYINSKVLFASGLNIGDKVEVKISKNKIALIKSKEGK